MPASWIVYVQTPQPTSGSWLGRAKGDANHYVMVRVTFSSSSVGRDDRGDGVQRFPAHLLPDGRERDSVGIA